jgi:hypothetical protein
MSEQNKSNLQAVGAGLLGFVAVMAVGGGALMLHSSHQAKSPPKPVAAAEPIDLGAPTLHDATVPAAPIKERRTESPAPLVGSDEDTELAEISAARSVTAPAPAAAATAAAAEAASSPESAPNARPAAQRLQTAQHADLHAPAHSSAVAANAEPASRKGLKAGGAKRPLAKLAPQATAPAPSIASIHYGVTSRDELMGRAAGPVYNIKGASAAAKSKPGESGKMASEMNEKLAVLQSQLDDNPALSAAQRDEIQKELRDMKKGVSDVGGSTR